MRPSSKANFFFVHDLMEKILSENTRQDLCLMNPSILMRLPLRCYIASLIAQSVWDYENNLGLENDDRVQEQTICLAALKHSLMLFWRKWSYFG